MPFIVRDRDHNAVEQLIDEHLQDASGLISDADLVVVGDTIDTENQDGFLRGHGTHVVDGKLQATVCGVVERVNKLVYVRPVLSRYNPELGDVVVGRVVDIVAKRWKVDLNSRQEASLLLSAVHLQGDVQRRRNEEDELNMRNVFRPGDLLSAEVQSKKQDGGVLLHTRSHKYGKLSGGHLLMVPANLIRRQKQHFVHLADIGVDVILGVNGLIWICPHVPRAEDGTPLSNGMVGTEGADHASPQQWAAATRVANVVRALSRLGQMVYTANIKDVYRLSLENKVSLGGILEPGFLQVMITRRR